MLEQSPKPPQFPGSLVVRSGDDGPAAEEKPPHVFRNGNVRNSGLPLQLFIFGYGYSYGASALEFLGVSAVFLHAFPTFIEREAKRRARWGFQRGLPLGRLVWLVAASYQPVETNSRQSLEHYLHALAGAPVAPCFLFWRKHR